MYNIDYSKQAEMDLEEAIGHIVTASKKNALAYLQRYENKIELLRLNPQMGTECKNKHIKRDCRVLVNDSHIVIYSIDETEKSIFIIRIFHSSVNYANKFNKEL